MRMRFCSSGGASFSQSVRGTTPNMAPPSRRNSPSLTTVSSKSPSSIAAEVYLEKPSPPGPLSRPLPSPLTGRGGRREKGPVFNRPCVQEGARSAPYGLLLVFLPLSR